MAERFLGGPSVKPKIDSQLIKQMFNDKSLLQSKFWNNPGFAKQIEDLPKALELLFEYADEHSRTTDKAFQKALRDQMHKMRNRFNYELLREALMRLTINGQAEGYFPWEPYPTDENAPKSNEFITDLHEKICEKMGVTEYSKVHYYSTTDTPLDYVYSTDGFFVFDGSLFPDKKRRIVYIDITLNKDKAFTVNKSGSLVLYLDTDRLEDEDLEDYQEEFSRYIVKEAKTMNPDTKLNDFDSRFQKFEKVEEALGARVGETRTRVKSALGGL